jgi:hypothetical protein
LITSSTDATKICNIARKIREKLKDLGCECIIVDTGKGAHEQTLIGAYAAYQSDDRFAISED